MDSQASAYRLDHSAIQAQLSTKRLGKVSGWDNELWDCLDSTNNRALELAAQGAPEGVIVMARQQTAGRGRLGRAWVSPADSGIYASFLLRPHCSPKELPLHTLACGVAAAQAIWDCVGIKIGLKWVNDLVFNGKKLGGILAEMPSYATHKTAETKQSQLPALIAGFGINIRFTQTDIPEELQHKIAWLEQIAGQPINPNLVLTSLATNLEKVYDDLNDGHTNKILELWKDYSVTLGRPIRAVSGNTTIEGLAVDVSDTGGLIVETKDRTQVVLHAGEITIRGANGTYA